MNPNPFLNVDPYPKDKPWGAVIVVLSLPSVLAGALFALLGPKMGEGFYFLAVALLSSAALQAVGGMGVERSRYRGFVLATTGAAVPVPLYLLMLPHGIAGLAASGAVLYYCATRLLGREGSAPI